MKKTLTVYWVLCCSLPTHQVDSHPHRHTWEHFSSPHSCPNRSIRIVSEPNWIVEFLAVSLTSRRIDVPSDTCCCVSRHRIGPWHSNSNPRRQWWIELERRKRSRQRPTSLLVDFRRVWVRTGRERRVRWWECPLQWRSLPPCRLSTRWMRIHIDRLLDIADLWFKTISK